MSSVTTPTWARDERNQVDAAARCRTTWIGGLDRLGGRLEAVRGRLDDRPQDVLLGGHVRVQAGPLDIDRARNIADARPRIAMRVEEGAGGVLDRLPAGRLDHVEASSLTNDR